MTGRGLISATKVNLHEETSTRGRKLSSHSQPHSPIPASPTLQSSKHSGTGHTNINALLAKLKTNSKVDEDKPTKSPRSLSPVSAGGGLNVNLSPLSAGGGLNVNLVKDIITSNTNNRAVLSPSTSTSPGLKVPPAISANSLNSSYNKQQLKTRPTIIIPTQASIKSSTDVLQSKANNSITASQLVSPSPKISSAQLLGAKDNVSEGSTSDDRNKLAAWEAYAHSLEERIRASKSSRKKVINHFTKQDQLCIDKLDLLAGRLRESIKSLQQQ